VSSTRARAIRTTRAARRARTHALVLRQWRRDVLRGARIGRSADGIDLPKRYRLDPNWVLVHLFRWDENRQVAEFNADWDRASDPFDSLTEGTNDDHQH
jgi:hypothetical protein